MMERPRGGFEWSYTHNCPFELSKTVLMNFPRSFRDHIPGGLTLDKPNADRTITSSIVLPVLSYKYLGILFDPKLCWSLQHAKALATATFWSSQLWRISKSSSGLSTTGTKQLYNTVVVPRFSYGAGGHSVQISDSDIDNIVTLYCLRRASGRPADVTWYMCYTGRPNDT